MNLIASARQTKKNKFRARFGSSQSLAFFRNCLYLGTTVNPDTLYPEISEHLDANDKYYRHSPNHIERPIFPGVARRANWLLYQPGPGNTHRDCQEEQIPAVLQPSPRTPNLIHRQYGGKQP